mmetsp:Transcript_21308/g.27202  ORF Transcript_21308/g.27202 Transcript_21308/m.27202 type:complete len:82 (+) Transcript_21308:30-275(+)
MLEYRTSQVIEIQSIINYEELCNDGDDYVYYKLSAAKLVMYIMSESDLLLCLNQRKRSYYTRTFPPLAFFNFNSPLRVHTE